MVEVGKHIDLTPWTPTATPLPKEWIALSNDLAQQAQGSPRAYVLKAKHNAQLVGELLRSWGLPWQVVMAGYLWEYEEKQIRRENLNDFDTVLSHISEATRYTRYIEDENLPPLLTPPYRDLGALLIAVAIYYQALRTLQQHSHQQPYMEGMQTLIENIGRTLLNIVKRLGMWGFKREIEDLIEQLRNPHEFAIDEQKLKRVLEEDTTALEYMRQLLVTFYQQATQQNIVVIYTPCGVNGMGRRRQDAHTTATSQKDQLTGFDLVTYDVIVPTVQACYTAFGVLSHLGYIQDRVTDHVAHPKTNGCSHIALGLILKVQDLHWSKNETQVCQIQIATHLMQAITHFGCLYPRYYQFYIQPSSKKLVPPSVQQLWLSEEGKIFLSSEEVHIQPEAETPIIVYDKSRKPIALRKGATVLDFAYTLDSAIGERAVDAIVNNRKAPLFRVLDAADIVEIRTANEIQAQKYWETYPTTSVTPAQIKESVDRRFFAQWGYSLLCQVLERYHYILAPQALDHHLRLLLKKHNFGTAQTYLERLGKIEKLHYTPDWAAQEIMRQIAEHNDLGLISKSRHVPVLDMQLTTNKRYSYRQRMCGFCQPSHPYDKKIVGRLRKDKTMLVVHRESCPHLMNRISDGQPELLPMTWQLHPPAFRVSFFLTAQDRPGLLLDITKHLRCHQCNFVFIKAVLKDDGEVAMQFTIEAFADKDAIDVLYELEKVKSVTIVEFDVATTPLAIYEHLQELRRQGATLPDRTPVELGWDRALASLEPRNPILKNSYDISRPASAKMFFGRSQETKIMQRELCEGENGKALILYGPRRSGKSSLCKNFLERQVQPPYWHVFYSLQNATRLSEEEILRQLADELCRNFNEQLHLQPPAWDHYHDHDPQVRFKHILQDCIAQLPGTRLVLALDEFGGAIDSFEQQSLDYRFFTYWKELMSEVPQLSLILALPTNAHCILTSERFSHAFNFAEPLQVMFLDRESAQQLLVDPLRDQQIAIHPYTVDLATKLTGGNPYYMTLIGQQLIHHLNQDPRQQRVLNEDMHRVVDYIMEAGANPNFIFYRQEVQGEHEWRILKGFVELITRLNQTAVPLKKIASLLKLPENFVRQHLQRLCNGLVLEEHIPKANSRSSSNPSYSFKIELLRIWLARNHWFFS